MKALICGCTGQDGAYLSKFLLDKGYDVIGLSRDHTNSDTFRLKSLNIISKISLDSMSLVDIGSVNNILKKYAPDEIYNLSGQTSVALSFQQPTEAFNSITIATLNLLDACNNLCPNTKLYNAGSSECFGDTGFNPANESTRFNPKSPYAIAKSSSFWVTSNYRESYGLRACTGILFNHESPLRGTRFVTSKIVTTAKAIHSQKLSKLYLGNIDITRDWGFAPDYVEAMWLMLNSSSVQDYVICTGSSHSLKHFVAEVFSYYSLDWTQFVETDPSLLRPTDILNSCGDPSLALNVLKWKAKVSFSELVTLLCDY